MATSTITIKEGEDTTFSLYGKPHRLKILNIDGPKCLIGATGKDNSGKTRFNEPINGYPWEHFISQVIDLTIFTDSTTQVTIELTLEETSHVFRVFTPDTAPNSYAVIDLRHEPSMTTREEYISIGILYDSGWYGCVGNLKEVMENNRIGHIYACLTTSMDQAIKIMIDIINSPEPEDGSCDC